MMAGTLTTMAFLPQVIKTWRSKSVKDISFGMFLLMTAGVFLWMVYGFCIGSLPVVLANAVTLVLNLIILALKVRYG